MADYRTEAPQILRDFLSYHETIKAHSKRTVDEYFLDLRNFFRYLKQTRDPSLCDRSLDEIDITDVDLAFVASVIATSVSTVPGPGPAPEQPEFWLRPERRVPGPEDRHDPVVLQLPHQ